MPHAALLALLAIYPRMNHVRCVEARTASIVANATQAQREYGVPPEILLTVAFYETHLGCDLGEGGGWGAPIDRGHRHTAGTPMHAARALARSYAVCGSWRGAVGRFRSGLCAPHRPEHRLYVRKVMQLAERIVDIVED